MTPTFHWNTGGYCRVINWSNFNIVVSQGIGRPKRERKTGEWPISGAVRTHIYQLSSPSYRRTAHGAPKQLQ